jgi:hypothetical protein
MERGLELERVSQSVCKFKRVASRGKEVWGAFYSPPKESAHWSVRNLDMSGLGAGHVRQPCLEPSLGTGHVRFRGLNPV